MQVLFYIADGDRVWPGENDVFSLLVTMQSSAASSWSGHRWLNRPRCQKTKMASPLTLSLPFLFPSYLVGSRHSVGESDPRFWGCCDGLRWRKRAFITSTFPMWWKGWTKMASDSWLNLKFEAPGSSLFCLHSLASSLHRSIYAVIYLAWPLQSLPFT